MASIKKKGQTEMIGLVVIVILITLGMLFAAQFALKENPQKKIFTRKGLSYSTMSTIMKTTVYEPNCKGDFKIKINPQVGKDLLEDCARNLAYADLPNGYSLYKCRNRHSCVFLEQFISEMLNATLGSWKKHYEFNAVLIQATEDTPLELFSIKDEVSGGCRRKERDSSGSFPIHTSAGLVQAELFLCD